MGIKTLPLMYVEWIDASAKTAGWNSAEDAKRMLTSEYRVCTVGWKMEKNDDAIILTEAVCLEYDGQGKLWRIPKEYIKRKFKIKDDRIPKIRAIT